MLPDAPQAFQTASLDRSEREAIKCCSQGTASEYQQQLALQVIVTKIARTHDVHFVPGAPDETAFLNGRAYVGNAVLKHINMPVDDEVTNDAT